MQIFKGTPARKSMYGYFVQNFCKNPKGRIEIHVTFIVKPT